MTLPLVLLHGFTGSSSSWDAVTAGLAPTPLHLSPLGHAPSTDSDARVRSFDDEIARLSALLPPEPIRLAGYSLGARLAMGIAVAHPQRIARLTLISGHTGLGSEAERRERRAADARWCALLETDGIEAFVDAWQAQPLFASQARLPAARRAARRAERLRHDPHGLARSLRVTGLGEMPDYAPHLASISVPVTLVVGELDAKFLALGRATQAQLPNGRLVLAPNAGHDLLLERPDLVALELRDEPQKP